MTLRWNRSRSIFLRSESSLRLITACLFPNSRSQEKLRFHRYPTRPAPVFLGQAPARRPPFPSVLPGKRKLASTGADRNEPVPEASLFCLRLGAPESGHLEASGLGVPWNHTHSHAARSKSVFAITGKPDKGNRIPAKSVRRRSAAPVAGSNLGRESTSGRGRSWSGQTGAATGARRRRAAPGWMRRKTGKSAGVPRSRPIETSLPLIWPDGNARLKVSSLGTSEDARRSPAAFRRLETRELLIIPRN